MALTVPIMWSGDHPQASCNQFNCSLDDDAAWYTASADRLEIPRRSVPIAGVPAVLAYACCLVRGQVIQF